MITSSSDNVDYEISEDGILTMRVDLNRCLDVKPNGQYVVARTSGYQDLLEQDGQLLTKTGLKFQLYVMAQRQRPEREKFIRERWPALESAAQALLDEE